MFNHPIVLSLIAVRSSSMYAKNKVEYNTL